MARVGVEGAVVIGRRPAAVAQTNPFLPGPASSGQGSQATPESEADIAGEPVMFTGPSAPTGAPAPQALVSSLLLDPPAVKPPVEGSFVVQLVGLHGGAGTSVLASTIGPTAFDCGVGVAGVADQGVPVVFVARAHGRGLDLALRAGQQWAARGLEQFTVLGLVLVADAPGQTRGLAAGTKSVRGAFPRCWQVAWSEDLRHQAQLPTPRSAPAQLRRVCKSVLQQAERAIPASDGDQLKGNIA